MPPKGGTKRALAEADRNAVTAPSAAKKGKTTRSKKAAADENDKPTNDKPIADNHTKTDQQPQPDHDKPLGRKGPGGVLMIPQTMPEEVTLAKLDTDSIWPSSWVQIDCCPGRAVSIGDKKWRTENHEWITANVKKLSNKSLKWIDDKTEEVGVKEAGKGKFVINYAVNGKEPKKSAEQIEDEKNAAKVDKFKDVAEGTKDTDWICICRPYWDNPDEDDDEEDEEDDEDDEEAKKAKEQKKKDEGQEDPDYLFSGKLADQFPKHMWVFTKLGQERHFFWMQEAMKRDQDSFRVYMYNDFTGYGALEVAENQMVQFDKVLSKPDKTVLELWSELEGIALWFLHIERLIGPQMYMIDDGPREGSYFALLGNAILSTFDFLKQKPDEAAQIRNQGLVIAILLHIAADPSQNEMGNEFDWMKKLIQYADENKIEIKGPVGIEKTLEKLRKNGLELASKPRGASAFGGEVWCDWKKATWAKEFKKYCKEYGKRGKIGGKEHDLTALTKSQRKQHSLADGGCFILF